MQEKISNIAIIEVVKRLKDAFNIDTDLELAELLGVKQNTISSWKSRGSIDYALIITKCDNIDLDWLFRGENEKKSKKNPAENVPPLEPEKMSPHCGKMSPHCVPPKQYNPNDGLTHDFDAKPDGKQEQKASPDHNVEKLQLGIELRDALLASKDELLAAKDKTIVVQNEALRLLEGQINATTALIEQLTLFLGNDAKKRPERADARDASDVGAR